MTGKQHPPAAPPAGAGSAPGPSPAEPSLAPPACRKLRTKVAFSALVDSEGRPFGWRRAAPAEAGSTAVFWCLCTMESAGPDGALVHGADCGPDRACYQAPE